MALDERVRLRIADLSRDFLGYFDLADYAGLGWPGLDLDRE
jgi:hypothetical protein